MNWLKKRLREPSTWRGLVWLATALGVSLSPEQVEAIVTAGIALAGLLGVLLPDEEKRHAVPPIELQSVPAAPADRLRVDLSAERGAAADRADAGWNG